jgi:hypothetical protein
MADNCFTSAKFPNYYPSAVDPPRQRQPRRHTSEAVSATPSRMRAEAMSVRERAAPAAWREDGSATRRAVGRCRPEDGNDAGRLGVPARIAGNAPVAGTAHSSAPSVPTRTTADRDPTSRMMPEGRPLRPPGSYGRTARAACRRQSRPGRSGRRYVRLENRARAAEWPDAPNADGRTPDRLIRTAGTPNDQIKEGAPVRQPEAHSRNGRPLPSTICAAEIRCL